MENKSPKQISIILALSLGFLAVGLLSLLNYWADVNLNLFYIFIFGIVISILGYLMILNAIERFIYHKVKLIYKTISNLKSSKNEKELVKKNSILLKDVEKDVLDWANTNRKEMTQLKKMETFRREFIGNVSHELKTPLFNVQGYIETLLDGGMRDHKINKKYLKKAAKNVDRLESIINDLSLISEIEQDNLQLNLEKFDIGKLVEEVIDSLEDQSNKSNVKLGFKNGYAKTYWVVADKEKIIQVLVNLFVNSIKYGKEDGETLVGCYDMEERILIEISDNGMGISKKHIPRLFERFYRVDSNRSRIQGGTGLGLAIVKHIIEAHNETVNVRSQENVGSSFSFTLKKAD